MIKKTLTATSVIAALALVACTHTPTERWFDIEPEGSDYITFVDLNSIKADDKEKNTYHFALLAQPSTQAFQNGTQETESLLASAKFNCETKVLTHLNGVWYSELNAQGVVLTSYDETDSIAITLDDDPKYQIFLDTVCGQQ